MEEATHIVFMGTPQFALPILEWLLSSAHQVVAVYTQPDRPAGRGQRLTPSPVKRLALERGMGVRQPVSLRGPEERDELARLKPDLVVVAAYGLLLPRSILEIPPQGCLNLHPSLLPRHRGPSPVAATILTGDDVTGVTLMLMDRGMDTGPILAQRSVAVESSDTTASLTARLALVAADLLREYLPLWLAGELTPQPQDDSRATVSRLHSKEEGEISWQLTALEIWRRVRALYPWPGCYTYWRGQVLKVLEAIPLTEADSTSPGRVVSLDAEGVALGVETGQGVLGLVKVQLEGRRPVTAQEFLRGHRDIVDAFLPDGKPSPP